MSRENVETVRAHLAALNARDLDGFLQTCTADVELWSLLSALEGPYVGAEGLRRFFGDLGDAVPDHSHDVVRLEAVGPDRVLSVEQWTATGRSSGVGVDEGFSVATVYEFSGGKIKRIRVFADVQEALEAVGLSEQAMSRENVEAWGKAIQAFNDRDFEGLVADFAPGIEFMPLIAGMTGQPYRGHQGVREWLEAIDEDWETFDTTADRVEDHDEFALAVGRVRGRGRTSGVELTRASVYLARFVNGKVVWWQTFETREEALEAVGLSE